MIKQKYKDNNSVYLFIYNNILDFNLVPFKSINDAISQAVNYIENVKIIHKGRIIKWDVINNNTAFYINPYNKNKDHKIGGIALGDKNQTYII